MIIPHIARIVNTKARFLYVFFVKRKNRRRFPENREIAALKLLLLLFIEAILVSLAEFYIGGLASFDLNFFTGERVYPVASGFIFKFESGKTGNVNVFAFL